MKKTLLLVFFSQIGFALPPDPNINDVVLNELLFNPGFISTTSPGQDCNGDGIFGSDGNGDHNAGDEFIEFYNNGVTDVNIEGYCITHDPIVAGGTIPDKESRWLIPNTTPDVIVPAGGFYHICGDDDGRGFGFSIEDVNLDEIQQFNNSAGTGNGKTPSLYQPITAGVCGSGIGTVIFSNGYNGSLEANGEPFLRCFTDGTSPLGYYNDVNGFFYNPTPGASNCAVATPVYLNYIKLSKTKVTWQTAYEFNHIGFNLYQKNSKNELIKLNESIISSNNSKSYEFILKQNQTNKEILITDVDAFANEKVIDSILPNRIHGTFETTKKILWDKELHTAKTSQKSNQISLLVSKDGIQKIRVSELINMGFNINGLPINNVVLKHNKHAVAYTLYSHAKTFTADDYLLFMGESASSIYTDSRIYTLSFGKNMNSITTQSAKPDKNLKVEDFYLATDTFEKNNFYEFSTQSQDPWMMQRLIASDKNPTTKNWTYPLPHLSHSKSAQNQYISVSAFINGVTNFPQENDHHIQLKINSKTTSKRFDGQDQIQLQLNHYYDNSFKHIDLSLIQPADIGLPYDLVNLDKFTLNYPHDFIATNGKIDFEFNQNSFQKFTNKNSKWDPINKRYQVSGFSTTDLVVVSKNSKATHLLTGISNKGNGVIEFSSQDVNSHIYISEFSKINSPELQAISKPVLHATDLLILTKNYLIPKLSSYVEQKQNSGLKVSVVDVDSIYAHYGMTKNDPMAIKNYISKLNSIQAISYVMLVGSDQYDYKNYLNTEAFSLIPTFYKNTGHGIYHAPTDVPYVDFNNDNIADTSIGRLVVNNESQLKNILDKINNYSISNQVQEIIITDNVEVENFQAIAQTLVNEDSLIIDSFKSGVPSANNQFIDTLNNGSNFVTWIGHSSSSRWSRDNVFSLDDIDRLENNPAIFFQLGCWNSYFVDPNRQSLTSALLQKQDFGAVATIGSSTYTLSGGEELIAKYFKEYRDMHEKPTIGNAFLYAITKFGQTYPDRKDILLGYQLLGDPTMVID